MSQTLVSIDYVRVKKIEGIKLVRGSKIQDYEFVRDDDKDRNKMKQRFYIYGTVIVTDRCGDHVVYHYPDVSSSAQSLTEYISLTGPAPGPGPRICGDDKFSISVDLGVKFSDDDDDSEIKKEIADGAIVWDTNTQEDPYEKPLEGDVYGKHGSVTVGYSLIREALTATIDVLLMNKSMVEIYGAVKAKRLLRGGSATTHWLIETPATLPRRMYPRCLVTIPVPLDSELTFEVDLWESHRSGDCNPILEGKMQFTPTLGSQKKNITGDKYGVELQVSVTHEKPTQ